MNSIKVLYKLKIGTRKFKKTIEVQAIPCPGTLLKAARASFIVDKDGVEQDLDSCGMGASHLYSHVSVTASINIDLYEDEHYDAEYFDVVIKELLKDGWEEKQ